MKKYRIIERGNNFYIEKKFLWFWRSIVKYPFKSIEEAEKQINELIKFKNSKPKVVKEMNG